MKYKIRFFMYMYILLSGIYVFVYSIDDFDD